MAQFRNVPMCEVCNANVATSFSLVSTRPTGGKPEWKFVCLCTDNAEERYVQIGRFFANPAATTDWLAHLHEIPEMDWHGFMDMVTRFRRATDSFNSL